MIDYSALWASMVILPHYEPLFDHVAIALVEATAQERYRKVEASTGVPWAIIAVIHEREASQSWIGNLAQGDPWNRRSIHVPKGRGPFGSWESAACDALENCPPFTAVRHDWSIAGALLALEEYNGLGYEKFHAIPSPYLWAGTNHYVKGKYVADGHFDPNAVDHQLGCAGLLRSMMAIEPSISKELRL